MTDIHLRGRLSAVFPPLPHHPDWPRHAPLQKRGSVIVIGAFARGGETFEHLAVRNCKYNFLVLMCRESTSTRAKLASSSAGSVIEVAGNPQVSIYDLEVTGATGPVGHGILVQPGKATVALERVTVNKNAVAGLYVGSGSMATASKSTVDANLTGIFVDGGSLEANQTTISGSAGAGVTVQDRGVETLTDSTLRGNHDAGGEAFTAGTLNVVRSAVQDNSDEGLMAAKGSLNVQRSTIKDNGLAFRDPGISAHFDSTVTVSQSTIIGNGGGGISIDFRASSILPTTSSSEMEANPHS